MIHSGAATTAGDPPMFTVAGSDRNCSTGCPHCGCYNPQCPRQDRDDRVTYFTAEREPSFPVIAPSRSDSSDFRKRLNRKPWESRR